MVCMENQPNEVSKEDMERAYGEALREDIERQHGEALREDIKRRYSSRIKKAGRRAFCGSILSGAVMLASAVGIGKHSHNKSNPYEKQAEPAIARYQAAVQDLRTVENLLNAADTVSINSESVRQYVEPLFAGQEKEVEMLGKAHEVAKTNVSIAEKDENLIARDGWEYKTPGYLNVGMYGGMALMFSSFPYILLSRISSGRKRQRELSALEQQARTA